MGNSDCYRGSGIDQGRRKLRFLGLGFLEQRGFGVRTMTPERGSGAGGYLWSGKGFQVVEQNCVCCEKGYGRRRLRDHVHQRCVAGRDDGCGMPISCLCCAGKGNGAVERCKRVIFKKEKCLRWCVRSGRGRGRGIRVRVSRWEGFWGFWTGRWEKVEKRCVCGARRVIWGCVCAGRRPGEGSVCVREEGAQRV